MNLWESRENRKCAIVVHISIGETDSSNYKPEDSICVLDWILDWTIKTLVCNAWKEIDNEEHIIED